MTQLYALDLFCGAGGATKGLQQAGFHVTGIDIVRSPRYCGDVFHLAPALSCSLDWLSSAFDFIWASPPCQAHTSLKGMHNAKHHEDLIEGTRDMLKDSGVPYVIENVVGAPLINPTMLCGTMFGLKTPGGAQLRRHRIFEASFPLRQPPCEHDHGDVIGIYGGHYRNRGRPGGTDRGRADFTADDGKVAMGIDWMTGNEISQAIPPAYSKWIANEFLLSRTERNAA